VRKNAASAGQWKRRSSARAEAPSKVKSPATVLKEVSAYVREVDPPKRRCELCRAFLRSGNNTNRCALCVRKLKPKELEE
jgi:hypothetical protein